MTFSTRREWSTEPAGNSDRRGSVPPRMPKSTIIFNSERPLAQLQPGETRQTQQLRRQELNELFKNRSPSTGRTTALGRRVEKPADVKPAGPSGQRDKAQHDRKHTNK